jgi:inhibitor of KinA
MFPFEIVPAGDAAILVQYPERIDPELTEQCIALANTIGTRLRSAVLDVVVGYCSVTAYFDPLTVDGRWLEEQVRIAATNDDAVPGRSGVLVEVPVCYGGEFGPDMGDVASFGNCSEQDVVRLHSSVVYRVFVVGFVPGFAYLAEVDRRIAAPRRTSPRTAVAPGSVAIAGGQTGIYPSATPGGWNIIGRTAVKPYDRARKEPFLLKAGDRVRFRPIGPDELQAAF